MMNQVDLKKDEFDFYINVKDQEMEVSFSSSTDISEAIYSAIKVAQKFKIKVILLFDKRKFLVDKDSKYKDIMEKYLFD